jgi:hypothetical protein
LADQEIDWNTGRKVQRLPLGSRELIIVKDLSGLRAEESASLLDTMAVDVAAPDPERVYLIAANHGQLLEKLKAAPQTPALKAMMEVVEELLVTGASPDSAVRLNLRDLSQAPASLMLAPIIDAMTKHGGWDHCEGCPVQNGGGTCPIWENRSRLQSEADGGTLRRRLTALIELSEQISLVDADSFWIDAYFTETTVSPIREGDPANIKLMGYSEIVRGHVGSISRGINIQNAQGGSQGLQTVNPIFTWVRLAQRIPVRIHIDHVPDGVTLAAGLTATVEVEPRPRPPLPR